MYYEWKVCNSSEIANHAFPYLMKSVVLENFYNQEYRLWMTEQAISLYQTGKRCIVLFKSMAGSTFKFGSNDYFRLEKLDDGTFDVFHGQEA